jgi:putative PIN family toxin of toxin-antitoxin system
MSLRVVFDTSTLVSAARRPASIPEQALQFAILFYQLYVSTETLAELERVLRLKKFDRYVRLDSRMEFVYKLRRDALPCFVPGKALDEVRGFCRDAKDDIFLALCMTAHADILVSSDQDLLVLDPWRGIAILPPAQFLRQFSA